MRVYEKFDKDVSINRILDYLEENGFMDRKSMNYEIVRLDDKYAEFVFVRININGIYRFEIQVTPYYYAKGNLDTYVLYGKMSAYTNDTNDVLLKETEISITK